VPENKVTYIAYGTDVDMFNPGVDGSSIRAALGVDDKFVVFDWQARLQQEGATATIEVADEAPVFHADKAVMKRVFANLLQNALTHSPIGVQVRLRARKDGDGILFTIADNGPGIPKEYHELIFRKFEQVRSANVPKTRSSGLGLAFCRLAVEGHDGRIWVQSEEGRGTHFHIRLPI
jgi:signal transduction histidine kinase